MRNALLVLLLVIVALAVYVATRPSEFLLTRTRTLAAPPEIVHAYVNDFHHWAEWSPWEKLDPNLQREFSGPPVGEGASYHWIGNDEVGEGRMTITESQPPEKVAIRLEFLRPFQATNAVEFYIDATGLGTEVTWAMSGHNNFVAKAFGVFTDVDKLVGKDFEQGLADLDAATAAAAKAAAPPPAPAPEATPAPAPGEAPAAPAPPPAS